MKQSFERLLKRVKIGEKQNFTGSFGRKGTPKPSKRSESPIQRPGRIPRPFYRLRLTTPLF
jgi:hypothetical protein